MSTERGGFSLTVGLSAAIALVSAFPFASGWNDGSRLATVESLVERHTWIIDGSLFLEPDADGSPYHPDDPRLRNGTLDKLLIGGHWYSDKSPVPALWLALCYQILHTLFGLAVREHPGLFCYLMTVCFSGLSYIVAAASIFRMATIVGLVGRPRLLLTASFGLATLALIYVRLVNSHLPFLAVTSLMTVQMAYMAKSDDRLIRWATLGLLASVGYCLDLGAGPPFVIALAGLAMTRTQGFVKLTAFLVAAFPLFLLHHILNDHIGGTFTPANAHAAYVQWPGSPFADMTGQWHHPSFFSFVLYSLDLLVGKAGFLTHNPALLLALPGLYLLGRGKRVAEWPFACWLLAGCVGVWLMYAVSSRNLSGLGCSIRWFLPIIAPGYFVLAVLIRERPTLTRDLAILSLGGAIMMGLGWAQTIWWGKMIPGFWFLLAGTLLAWAVCRPLSPRVESMRKRPAEPESPDAAGQRKSHAA